MLCRGSVPIGVAACAARWWHRERGEPPGPTSAAAERGPAESLSACSVSLYPLCEAGKRLPLRDPQGQSGGGLVSSQILFILVKDVRKGRRRAEKLYFFVFVF